MTARRTKAAPPAVPPPTVDRDLAEMGGGWFEEASDHVAALPLHKWITFGPVAPVPSASLIPGILGWERGVTKGGRPANPPAAIYYLLGHAEPGRTGPSPLRGIDWSEFVAVELCEKPREGFILALGPVSAKAAFQQLVSDIRAEIANLDD